VLKDGLTGISAGPSYLLATVESPDQVESLITSIQPLKYDLGGPIIELLGYKFGAHSDDVKPIVWTVQLGNLLLRIRKEHRFTL